MLIGKVVVAMLAAGVLTVTGCDNAADGGSGGLDIWMCEHEVTQSEWKVVMGDDDLNDTMYNVSWYDTLVYCNRLSLKENLKPCYKIKNSFDPKDWGEVPKNNNDTWNAVTCDFTANGFRLPTRMEWIVMARGGKNYKYSGSDNIDEVACYYENSGIKNAQGESNENKAHEVKKKLPNLYGMYDMSGNVSEWCWDWYYFGESRDLRGGNWFSGQALFCAVSYKEGTAPYRRGNNTYGFRVVRRWQ